jgi:hypothetical protein
MEDYEPWQPYPDIGAYVAIAGSLLILFNARFSGGLPLTRPTMGQGSMAQPLIPRNSDIERQLLEMISRSGGHISAGTAAKELGVTPEQVRGTLQDLERRGLIRL